MPALTPQQARVLEFFWDSNRKVTHSRIPLGVLAFLDAASREVEFKASQTPEVMVVLEQLVGANYLRRVGGGFASDFSYELNATGGEYIARKHPTALVWWDRILERTPSIVTFLIAVVGFAASILGIVQFVQR